MRGLSTLQKLNQHNGATVTDIARAVGLARTTAYRVLETLCEAEYAVRDPSDDRYRLTIKVRSLSDGYDDDAWVKDLAKPLLTKLGREVIWPLAISTLHGTTMMVRETTDKDSPLALDRYSPGIQVHMLGSASGRVHLAFCGEELRNTLLDILASSDDPEDRPARNKELVSRLLNKVRDDGYALSDNPRFAEISVAVPLLVRGAVLGGIVMRFIRSAMTTDRAVERYVPFLQTTAQEISEAYENQGYAEKEH